MPALQRLSCARLWARVSQKPGAKSRRRGCITCYGLSDVRPDDLPAFAVANGILTIRKYTRALLASPEPRTTQAPSSWQSGYKSSSASAMQRVIFPRRTRNGSSGIATELGLAEAKGMEEQKATEAAERVARQLTCDFKLVQEQIPVLQASNATLQKRMARQLAHAASPSRTKLGRTDHSMILGHYGMYL